MKPPAITLQSYSPHGVSSFSRNDCAPCGESTLHKHGRCVHCGTGVAGSVSKVERLERGRLK